MVWCRAEPDSTTGHNLGSEEQVIMSVNVELSWGARIGELLGLGRTGRDGMFDAKKSTWLRVNY